MNFFKRKKTEATSSNIDDILCQNKKNEITHEEAIRMQKKDFALIDNCIQPQGPQGSEGPQGPSTTPILPTVESYTMKWQVKSGWSDANNVFHKCFIDKNDTKIFEKQLKECAKFIGAWISVETYKN